MTRDRDAPAPRPCPGFPRKRERRGGEGTLRSAQGERGITILWRAQGERTPLPRTSGYRLSPVRRGGCAGRRVLIVAEGRVPLRRDGRFAKRPYDPLRGGR